MMKCYTVLIKRILTAFVVSVSLSLFIASWAVSYDFFDWEHGHVGYEIAVMDAEEDEEPFILYFHRESDELSEKMNSDYFIVYEVEGFLADIPKAEIDPNEGEQEKALAAKHGVKQFPAFFVSIPSFGGEPQRIHPFSKDHDMTADEFIQTIKSFITSQYNRKGYDLFEKKEHENALKYFGMASEFDPDRAYTYYAVGVVYHTIGFEEKDLEYIKKAEENFLKALKLDPKHKESEQELERVLENVKILGFK